MDTPTLEEAASQAFDGEIENLPAEQPKQTPTPEQPVQEGQPVVEAQKAEMVEESFTKVDPNSLPDELKGVYKSLQADYTRKRQEERRLIADLEKKLEGQTPQQDQPRTNLSPEEQMKEVAEQTFVQKRMEEWVSNARKEIEQLDPRLDENHPDYDLKFDTYARDALEKAITEYADKNSTLLGFDYKEELDKVSDDWKQYVDKLNNAFIEKQNKLRKDKAENLSRQNPPKAAVEAKPSGNMSFNDAIEAAFQE